MAEITRGHPGIPRKTARSRYGLLRGKIEVCIILPPPRWLSATRGQNSSAATLQLVGLESRICDWAHGWAVVRSR